MTDLLQWYLYEISAEDSPLHSVKLRGKIRKFAIVHGVNIQVENATDKDNVVRFAVLSHDNARAVSDYVVSIIHDAKVVLLKDDIQNPVLSKMIVNTYEKY